MHILNHFSIFWIYIHIFQLLVYGYLDISEYILARCKYAPFLKLVKYGWYGTGTRDCTVPQYSTVWTKI